MSKPAAFILATTDSRSDNLITRKVYLHDKIRRVLLKNKECYNKAVASGKVSATDLYDIRPTIADVDTSHIIYVREQYKPNVSIAYEYFKTEVSGGGSLSMSSPCTVSFNISGNSGDFLNDMVVHVRFRAIGTADPVNLTDGSYNANAVRYRYAEKPGIKLMRRTSLKYDEDTIDEYTMRDLLFYDKFRISSEKRSGWNDLIGQENPKIGNYYHRDQRVNQCLMFKNGPQTPQPRQEMVDLWIPLIFWCNLDVRQSLMSGSIVTLQQKVEIEMSPLNDIIQALDANDNIIPMPTELCVDKLELYTKNIYLDPEISDLFKNRPSLSLIRVHKQQEIGLDTNSGRKLLNQLKFPVEYMYLGFLPEENLNSFDNWHKYHRRVTQEVSLPATIINPATWPVLQVVSRTGTFYDQEPCINNIELLAHTTQLYKSVPVEFFNRYTPWHFSGMTTPSDMGAYFVPFSLYPDQFQPSGYVQLSKIREIYLAYEGNDISRNNKCYVYISAIALNFISIDIEGNAILKFAT